MLSSNSPETAAGNLTVAAVFVISLFFKISFHHLLSRIISKRHAFETACRSFLYSFLHDKSDRILQNASYFFFLVFFLLFPSSNPCHKPFPHRIHLRHPSARPLHQTHTILSQLHRLSLSQLFCTAQNFFFLPCCLL